MILPGPDVPSEATAGLCIAALRPVGARGFALCSTRHVFAFDVQGGAAVLTAVVAFGSVAAAARPPSEATRLPSLHDTTVREFAASPYEFLVVFEDMAAAERRRNAFACCWPTSPAAAGGTTKCATQFKSWASVGSNFKETSATAICLNDMLWDQSSPAASALAAHAMSTGRGTATAPSTKLGLVALSAPGVGVSVLRWGVEASDAVEELRQLQKQGLQDEEKKQHMDRVQLQLKRARERLRDIEKLEEKAKDLEGGVEDLSEEQRTKVAKRAHFEMEISRMELELGIDADDFGSESESESSVDEEEVARQKKLEKDRLKTEQKVSKRGNQKEREKGRKQKGAAFGGGDDE